MSNIDFFLPAPAAIVETDLILSKGLDRDYSFSQKLLAKGWIPPYTAREGKTAFELQENKRGQSKLANKLTGRFQYVVYRDEKANDQITMDIGSGAHYLIGRGRERAIIAGEIDFHEGHPIEITDGSGTYHYRIEGATKEKREKIYAAQEAALRALNISDKIISSLQRFVPLQEVTTLLECFHPQEKSSTLTLASKIS